MKYFYTKKAWMRRKFFWTGRGWSTNKDKAEFYNSLGEAQENEPKGGDIEFEDDDYILPLTS